MARPETVTQAWNEPKVNGSYSSTTTALLRPGYLAAYEKVIKADPYLGALEGRIHPDRPRRLGPKGCPENENGGMFWTSNLCVKKKIFFKLGQLDERFEVTVENVDFAYRLQKSKFLRPLYQKPLSAILGEACVPEERIGKKGL